MPTGKANIRASYYKALNRPGFLEIVPFQESFEDYNEAGNPEVKHTTAHNFDFRYEYFPKPLDQFLIGVFFKKIIDPIEYTFVARDATSKLVYMPDNFGNAVNYGLEMDIIQYFRSFGVKANYTWTHSEITTPKLLPVRDTNGNLVKTFPEQTRPLFGQSEHVVNISALFKDTRNGIDAQLAAVYSSDRIASVSEYLDNDIWERGAIKLDFSCEKSLNDKLNLFLKINNLLNTPREEYVRMENPAFADYPEQTPGSGETLVRRDYYEASYLIGIRYRFK
jgi:outer membrane receptor protein involved in Fe transport